jgi:uncharacterized membrane protein YphA (DoxX/SURF4 family)
LRRFFSTFVRGGLGVALLLMRVVAGGLLIGQGALLLRTDVSSVTVVLAAAAIVAGVLLVVGLWTPIAALFTVILVGLWHGLSQADDPIANLLLATIAISLALSGPGAYSCDARLFGWERIQLRNRTVKPSKELQ